VTTRFLAAVAELYSPTADRRVLDTPAEKILYRGRAPVLAPAAGPGHGLVLGFMDSAGIVGSHLVVAGELYRHREPVAYFVSMLKAGIFFLEIDIHPDRREVTTESGPAGPRVFKDWSVQAAHAGKNPCWSLPKMVTWDVEE